MGAGRLIGDGMPLYILTIFSNMLGRAVLNNTGLTGKFDRNPLLIDAVEIQLGRKLESTHAPQDVLVIDHIEHPSAN